jgi:hypothetical protein
MKVFMDYSVPFSIVLIKCAGVPKILVELAISEFVKFSIEIWCEIEDHKEANHESN